MLKEKKLKVTLKNGRNERKCIRREIMYINKSMKPIVPQLKIFKKQLLTTTYYIESVTNDLKCVPHVGNMNT